MAKMQKRILPIFLLAASLLIGSTGATVLHKMSLENPIKTPPVHGIVEEDLQNGAKKAHFINTGEADVFLRVGYTETWLWSEGEGKETIILPNKAKTKTGDIISPAVLKVNKPGETQVTAPALDTWTAGSDGWVYYNKVLPGSIYAKAVSTADLDGNGYADVQQTPNFVDTVNFQVDDLVDERYKTAKYELHFTMEVVQASDEAAVSNEAVEQLFKKSINIPADWNQDKYSYSITWN